MSASTPPKLGPMRASLQASIMRLAPDRPPLTMKLTTPPKPRICARAMAWLGWDARPG